MLTLSIVEVAGGHGVRCDGDGRQAREESDEEFWNGLAGSHEVAEWDRLQSIQTTAQPFTRGQRPMSRLDRLLR